MALALVSVEAPATVVAGALGRAWAAASQVVAPWRAWASMLGATLWTTAFVVLTTTGSRVLRVSTAVGRAAARFGAAMAVRADRRPERPPDRPRRGPTPRQVFRVAVWAVVVLFVGTFAAALAVPYWYQLHGQRLLIVTSGSMSPFVEAGDAAVLQLIDDPSQLRVGQVATFYPPGSKHMVTHRIVDLQMLPVLVQNAETGRMEPQYDANGDVIERPYIFTKGDANETQDPNATSLTGVRGVVVDARPGWGTALGWAQSRLGRFVLLAPPLLLLASLELADSLAERRRRPVRRPARQEVDDALGAL